MNEKEKFIKVLEGLFGYWGGDPYPEAYWVGNDLLDWLEAEYAISLGARFDESDPGSIEKVINLLRSIDYAFRETTIS
jgi:hypothetical protein